MARVGGVRIKWDRVAIAALKTDPEIVDYVREAAAGLAQAMASAAPRRTGAGAESIAARPARSSKGAFDVGWDPAHYYLTFQETFANLGSKVNPNFRFAQSTVERYVHD